ncbi:DUF4258 domain-containing protein [Candidatus Saganbacteria bacterium]|nr:DUF4258 domain-containing protein [Candidatus Saganbacteria bacterium]
MWEKIKFEINSALGCLIRTNSQHWNLITKIKHPEIDGKEKEVIESIKHPVEIRRSLKDRSVYLYYKKSGNYYYCVVVKHLNGEGFIITAYLTKNIKEGEIVWKK